MTVGANQFTDRASSPGPQRLVYAAADVGALADGLGRLGYDVHAPLAAAGLTRPALQDPDGLVACEACGAMFEAAQRTRPIRNFMLRLAEVMPLGAFPLFDYLVATADTVAGGYKQLSRYFPLVGIPILFEFHEDEDPVRVVMHNPIAAQLEFDLVLSVLHMRRETNEGFQAVALHLSHALDDVEEYERALGCPVRAPSTWSGLLLPREVWQLPMRRGDSVLRSVLERHANEIIAAMPAIDGIALDVRRALATRVAGGDVRIEAVARQLATTPRTLQRRLAAVGLSYQSVVEQIRREAAERHLAAPTLSIAEIGYLLGYSEAAAFHRAFKTLDGSDSERVS
jgi:AraC-like DNA-binding protein